MFRVVFLEPTFETCGGNHRTEDKPAEEYAKWPTAVLITQRKPEDFRMVKFKNRSFFKQFGVNYHKYCCADYEYNFETQEAKKKWLYEARGRGDYVKTRQGWVQM